MGNQSSGVKAVLLYNLHWKFPKGHQLPPTVTLYLCLYFLFVRDMSPAEYAAGRSPKENPLNKLMCISPLGPSRTHCVGSLDCSHGPISYNSPEKEVKQRPWKHTEWVEPLPLKPLKPLKLTSTAYCLFITLKGNIRLVFWQVDTSLPGWYFLIKMCCFIFQNLICVLRSASSIGHILQSLLISQWSTWSRT